MKPEIISLTKPSVCRPNIPSSVGFAVRVLATIMMFGELARAEGVDAGFFLDHFQLTLEDGERTEAAGPFFYSQRTDAENVLALPPFFSRERRPAVEFQTRDYLYPLWTEVDYGREHRWQFLELFSASSGLEPDGDQVRRLTLFPLYFQQRAADTNLNYTALAPFYGRLKHRLFRDEIRFLLFPGYVQTRKRDVVTDNYFYPFVDVRRGDGLTGWQVWPLAGREHKDVTTQTNGFGDVTVVAGHDQSFYLWPLYLSQNNGVGTDHPETLRASIPAFALDRSPQRDSTSVLWPLFAWIDDRDKQYHEWQGPWPFVIFARGEGKHTSRVWPLFSQSHNATKESDSWLWPLWVFNRTHSDPLDQRRTRVLFYLYSRLESKNTETGKARVRLDMWPFFTWRHDFNGNERLQVLAPLEPAVPDNAGIERNWSPLWSLWRAEQNAATGAHSESLLWNLYRRDATPAQTNVSCLFGLYQSRTRAEAKTTRLFYFPFSRPAAKQGSGQ